MSASVTAESIPVESLAEWRGADVIDKAGDKIGKLDDVYYDAESDLPAFVTIKAGIFGKHLKLVPLSGATAGRSHVRVIFTKDDLKEAPELDPGVEITTEQEAATYQAYGLEYVPTRTGARRLAKR
jgi:uncharacterized protein YrrD